MAGSKPEDRRSFTLAVKEEWLEKQIFCLESRDWAECLDKEQITMLLKEMERQLVGPPLIESEVP